MNSLLPFLQSLWYLLWSGLAGTRTSPLWILLELRVMEVVVTIKAIRCAKLQSNRQHQQTDIQFFYRPDALPVAVCCPCSIVGRCAPLYLCYNPASILQCADKVSYQKLHLLLETCTVTRTCPHPQPSHCSFPLPTGCILVPTLSSLFLSPLPSPSVSCEMPLTHCTNHEHTFSDKNVRHSFSDNTTTKTVKK